MKKGMVLLLTSCLLQASSFAQTKPKKTKEELELENIIRLHDMPGHKQTKKELDYINKHWDKVINKMDEAKIAAVKNELKVGNPMPDIPLGELINSKVEVMKSLNGKTRFSQLKGKLVILDFWDINCSSCIEEMPRMAKLQEEFKNQVQILLVDYIDSKEQILNDLALYKKRGRENYLPTNIPSIMDNGSIKKLFPPKTEIGYHVWIDAKGIIKLRGSGLINTYPKKVRDLLAGKKIDFVTDDGTMVLTRQTPLYTVLNKSSHPILKYNSTFTSFAPEIASYAGAGGGEVIDSAFNTIRLTWPNTSVLDLYYESTRELMQRSNYTLLGNRIILLVKDTLNYLARRPWFTGELTDKIFSQSRFCYEQICPLDYDATTRQQYMLQDLNRNISSLYGAEGRVEKRKMPCYILVRNSQLDKLAAKENNDKNYSKTINGNKMMRGQGELMNVLMSHIGWRYYGYNAFVGLNDILIDETEYKGKIDIWLPASIKSWDELRKALLPYDLDIIKEERQIDMLVIEEKDYKNK
jgi:thiol-disulfide isomerase/thioredoxin